MFYKLEHNSINVLLIINNFKILINIIAIINRKTIKQSNINNNIIL